jgi:hypothetical protein
METRVAVRAPFRLDLTANVFRRLSTNVVDRFDGGTYCRLIGESHAPSLLTVVQRAPDAVGVRIDGPRSMPGSSSNGCSACNAI